MAESYGGWGADRPLPFSLIEQVIWELKCETVELLRSYIPETATREEMLFFSTRNRRTERKKRGRHSIWTRKALRRCFKDCSLEMNGDKI